MRWRDRVPFTPASPGGAARCPQSLVVKKLLVLAAIGVLPTLTACGDSGSGAPIAVQGLSPEQSQPRPAVAAGALGAVADSAEARRRIGFVHPAALAEVEGPLSPSQMTRAVLGDGAAALEQAPAGTLTATQIGAATVLGGSTRTIVGGSSEQRKRLAVLNPETNLLQAETPSAVQSCLGDVAAETIVGPGVLGVRSAIGAAVIDTQDPPAGPKLVICATPHFYRDLGRVERRIATLFPSDGLPPEDRPVIGEQEIGERDIMGAAIALDQVPASVLRNLLEGGDQLVALGAAGPAGGAGDDSGAPR